MDGLEGVVEVKLCGRKVCRLPLIERLTTHYCLCNNFIRSYRPSILRRPIAIRAGTVETWALTFLSIARAGFTLNARGPASTIALRIQHPRLVEPFFKANRQPSYDSSIQCTSGGAASTSEASPPTVRLQSNDISKRSIAIPSEPCAKSQHAVARGTELLVGSNTQSTRVSKRPITVPAGRRCDTNVHFWVPRPAIELLVDQTHAGIELRLERGL